MMRWLRNVILGDPECTRCTRLLAACVCTTNPNRAVRRQLPRDRSAIARQRKR